jgi:tetratricopeptide (TPR) repeat protein
MEVKEQWWALLNFLYYEQENWPKVLETLEILVRDFPKREYWVRLAGVYAQEGEEKKAAWTYEAAYAGGFLNRQSDLTSYAGFLMQEEVPYRAAKVLDKGLKDGVIEESARTLQSLGQAWQLAQETEKAIPVLEKAGRLSEDGKIYERLAQLYLDNDEFDKCVAASDNALAKGGLRKVQSVHIVKGMCLYNQDKLSTARTAFVSCRNEARRADDDSNQRICQQWITYIDRESNRREELEKAI